MRHLFCLGEWRRWDFGRRVRSGRISCRKHRWESGGAFPSGNGLIETMHSTHGATEEGPERLAQKGIRVDG